MTQEQHTLLLSELSTNNTKLKSCHSDVSIFSLAQSIGQKVLFRWTVNFVCTFFHHDIIESHMLCLFGVNAQVV